MSARFGAVFWPEIVDVETARTAAKQGAVCAWFVAVATATFSALAMAGVWNIVDPGAVFDALRASQYAVTYTSTSTSDPWTRTG